MKNNYITLEDIKEIIENKIDVDLDFLNLIHDLTLNNKSFFPVIYRLLEKNELKYVDKITMPEENVFRIKFKDYIYKVSGKNEVKEATIFYYSFNLKTLINPYYDNIYYKISFRSKGNEGREEKILKRTRMENDKVKIFKEIKMLLIEENVKE